MFFAGWLVGSQPAGLEDAIPFGLEGAKHIRGGEGATSLTRFKPASLQGSNTPLLRLFFVGVST